MKRVYLGNKELTTIATVTNGGGGGDDTQKWVDYFNGTLTEFTVPEGVTKIKDYAFNGCSSLTSVTIPNSVTKIGDSTFSGCKSLTSITIPKTVKWFGSAAFSFCINLQSITIPSGYTSFQHGLFYGCSSLQSVTIENSNEKATQNSNVFYGISSTAKLYVPSNLLADYQADSKWTNAFKGGIYAIQ